MHAIKKSADDDLAVSLDGHVPHPVGGLAVKGLVEAAVGIETRDIGPASAIVTGEISADENAAVNLRPQTTKGVVPMELRLSAPE